MCRTGGDEFTVICPETDLDTAMMCAERVRGAVEAMRVTTPANAVLTGSVSIGVATRDADIGDVDALLKRADEGVYVAKQQGRNHVAAVQRLLDESADQKKHVSKQ